MKYINFFILLCLASSLAYAQPDTEQWTLQECIDYALQNNLNVQRSQLNVESSQVNYDQSKMALLPNANASGSYGFGWGRSIDPTTNLFVDNQRIASSSAGLNSSVTVFSGFQLRNSLKQNQLAFEASTKGLEDSKNDVMFSVISFYTNVLFTKELFENAKKQLSSTDKQVELTRKQVSAGALPKSNLLDLLAQRATNEVNVVNSENNYTLAKIQLKQALQLPPEKNVDIVVPDLEVGIEPALELSALEIYNIAVSRQPDVQGAQLNLESAKMGVAASKGALYPSLTLSGGLGTQYSDAADRPRFVPDGGDPITIPNPQIGFVQGTNVPVLSNENTVPSGAFVDGYSFGDQFDDNLRKFISLGIRIPIFNGFSAKAGIQRAQVAQRQAEINEKDVKYQLWQTIEQAYTNVLAAAKSYNAAQKQVEARKESFRVTQQRYQLRAVNSTDYQIAENDLFQAKSDLVRAKYDYIFKLKVLDFYQGKPLDF